MKMVERAFEEVFRNRNDRFIKNSLAMNWGCCLAANVIKYLLVFAHEFNSGNCQFLNKKYLLLIIELDDNW